MDAPEQIEEEFEAPNPPRQGIKKGIYLIPSAFTAANILMGFYAIMSALRGFQMLGLGAEFSLHRADVYFDNAAKAIGWAVLFDTLDGRIARMTKTTTEIGVQFDSIADVVTFGIAPAVLVYVWSYGSVLREGSQLHKLGWAISFMYLICGGFRLARFNVQSARPRVMAEGTQKVDKKSFVGMPIPAAAALIATLVHFYPQPFVAYEPQRSQFYSILIMVIVGTLSGLMVSTIRYPSFKSAGAQHRSPRSAILIVGLVLILIWLYSRYVLMAMVLFYVLSGLVLRLVGLFRKPTKSSEVSN